MANTTNKGYPLPVIGGSTNTWGTLLNSGLTTIDANLGGTASINCAGSSDVTLTTNQAENYYLSLTGLLTGNISVLVPQTGSFYRVKNGTTGAYTVTIKTTNGSSVGVIIPQGSTWEVASDGTNVSPCNWNDGTQFYCQTTGGTSSAITGTSRVPVASYFDGLTTVVKMAAANAANATFNLNGIGDKPIYIQSGTSLAQISDGALAAGQDVTLVYDTSLNGASGGWQAPGLAAALSNVAYTNVDNDFSADETFQKAIVVGSATGGALVDGSLNASVGVYINGSQVAASVCNGRVTPTSGLPYATNVAGATTLYFTPYLGNQVGIYDGTRWRVIAFSELSLAVPATTNTNYDLFLDWNSGTPQLASTAWSSSTARATNIALQDGVYVLSGTPTKRYLGTFRTGTSSGQVPFTQAKRFVWNYYNRLINRFLAQDTTDSWAYSTATWRQANGSTANQVEYVAGVAEGIVQAQVISAASGSAGGQTVGVAIGFDSTTLPSSAQCRTIGSTANSSTVGVFSSLDAWFVSLPSVGYHTLAWLEIGNGSGTQTFYGDNGASTPGSGLTATMEG